MNVVVNPKIQEELAAMGDVNTYFGSIHDRMGPEINSYSAAKAFSGTPRSFSERMALEEAMGRAGDDDEEDEEA
jgi:hypothetical protein